MNKSANATQKLTDFNPENRSAEPPQHPIEPSTPLPLIDRVNQAYKLVYGEDAKIPIQHESVNTRAGADWFVRSYMGGLFATPNDNPLTQKFENLEQLLTWFNETYPNE